ncbi:HAD family hydrolase [Lapillicoccus jejuensis]|uniref:HAD superfamily hydrolase (TIGR01509 family) n=1 Tax=Lapillicoccus jejuensis TaxID=402171 RepID=A0A542DXL2_9MICO|nr:HAD family hydrolase [Lapillicoccus jejuensis]TQJ07816.1 HAD superfamily hydrolase (TIGR01509 family) [Lapillicoccus jejuensis]
MTRDGDSAPQGVAAVLLDVDGTLVDTTYVQTLCWWQALRQHGRLVPMATVHRAIGLGSDKIVEHLLREAPDDEDVPGVTAPADEVDVDAVAAAHDALVSTWHERLVPLPGARELVRWCHDAGLVTVLCTSAGERDLAALRRVLDVEDAVDEVTSSEDAERSKPDTDILEVALDRIGRGPGEALFVGDAVWDVEAAGRLGMPCVGLECGGTSAAELQDAGAVATYADPAALLAGLPALLERLATGSGGAGA